MCNLLYTNVKCVDKAFFLVIYFWHNACVLVSCLRIRCTTFQDANSFISDDNFWEKMALDADQPLQ